MEEWNLKLSSICMEEVSKTSKQEERVEENILYQKYWK